MTILYSRSMSKIPSFFFPCLALLWTLAPFHVVPAETRSTQVLFKNSTLLTVMKHYHAFESFQDLKFRFGIFLHLLPRINWFLSVFFILKTRWFFLKMILIEKCFTRKSTWLWHFCMNQHYTEVVGSQITYLIFVQALIETDLTLNNFSENTMI